MRTFLGQGDVVVVKDDGREGACHVVLAAWLKKRLRLALLDDGRTVRVSQLWVVVNMVPAAFAQYARMRGLLTLERARRLLKPGARVVFTQAAKQRMGARGAFPRSSLRRSTLWNACGASKRLAWNAASTSSSASWMASSSAGSTSGLRHRRSEGNEGAVKRRVKEGETNERERRPETEARRRGRLHG